MLKKIFGFGKTAAKQGIKKIAGKGGKKGLKVTNRKIIKKNIGKGKKIISSKPKVPTKPKGPTKGQIGAAIVGGTGAIALQGLKKLRGDKKAGATPPAKGPASQGPTPKPKPKKLPDARDAAKARPTVKKSKIVRDKKGKAVRTKDGKAIKFGGANKGGKKSREGR